MEEEWRAIPGYEGLYEVSNLGRVKGHRGRLLKPLPVGSGYRKVILCKKGEPKKPVYIHRLVLTVFSGPGEGKVAMHLNHIRDDNRLDNLIWGTSQENSRDMVAAGRHAEQRKLHCPQGHPLLAPNLVQSELRKGARKCRACNIAHARMQRGEKLTLQESSDRALQQIERGEI